MKYLQKCIYPLIIILNIQISFSKKIYIEYNEEFDFITKDGKYYFPVSDSILNKKNKKSPSGNSNSKNRRSNKRRS
jgi:hypothetical protein